MIRPGGCAVLVGIPIDPVPFDISAAQAREARIETIFRYANVYARTVALIGSGKIDLKPLITGTFPFEDSIRAFERAAEGRGTDVKIADQGRRQLARGAEATRNRQNERAEALPRPRADCHGSDRIVPLERARLPLRPRPVELPSGVRGAPGARSEGTAFVGDYIGPFQPGNLVLVGPNLPHHWESDRRPGEVVRERDVALHFDPSVVQRAPQTFPEMAEIEPVVKDSLRGLEFHGETARRGAVLLERIGVDTGVRRLLCFLDLLHLLARSREREALASVGYLPNLDREAPPVIQKIMQYILANMDGHLRMAEAARLVGMSEPTFCRFFKRNTGNNFVGYVRKLRIGAACKLLVESSLPVTDICYEVGYQNVSNFNRHFRTEKGVTPSRYRRLFMYKGDAAAPHRMPPRPADDRRVRSGEEQSVRAVRRFS